MKGWQQLWQVSAAAGQLTLAPGDDIGAGSSELTRTETGCCSGIVDEVTWWTLVVYLQLRVFLRAQQSFGGGP